MRPPLLAPTGAALAAVLLAASPAAALDDGLARTPPMGWNGWYAFGCRVNDKTVRATARALVRSGMRDAGYRYVNLDDCWMARARGRDGGLRPDHYRFRHGIRSLADYVHRRGLKLGIYLSAGRMTCARRPGSAGYLKQDARTVASWGVDLVKLDWCFAPRSFDPSVVYASMRDALAQTGRAMVLSICDWGLGHPWVWGPRTGHMWRTAHDLPTHSRRDRWKAMLRVAARNERLASHAGPGAWNDPDILHVGLDGLTAAEGRTMFSLWAMMAAPLLAGNDVIRMDRTTRRTLLNREVIRVDQDRAGIPGLRVAAKRGRDVWIRPLHDGTRAVLLVNRTGRRRRFVAHLRSMFGGIRSRRFRVRDLWAKRTRTRGARLRMTVSPHGAAMLRIRPL